MIFCFNCNSIESYKLNETVNKFVLAGNTFMPEMHLKQPGFTYSACEPFKKAKQRKFKNLKKQEKQNIFTTHELGKACSQHGIPYEDFKDLVKRTAFKKVLIDKVFKIASNPEYDGYQRGLASMVYKFLDKKSSASSVNNEFKQNQQLADKLAWVNMHGLFL